MEKHKNDHLAFHASDVNRLAAVTTTQQMQESDLVRTFRNNKVPFHYVLHGQKTCEYFFFFFYVKLFFALWCAMDTDLDSVQCSHLQVRVRAPPVLPARQQVHAPPLHHQPVRQPQR